MDIKRLAWKSFSISKDELIFILPLFVIYFLSGSFFAAGQIFSETLFLKTYGAAGFSHFFIINGITIITAGVIYNNTVLRFNLNKGFIFLVTIFSLIILSSSILYKKNIPGFPFCLYLANYLFTVFLDIHFFNYAFLFLTIRNSKRILPFIMSGGKLGGIICSAVFYYVFSKDVSRYGLYVWAVSGFIILIPLLFFKTGENNINYLFHKKTDKADTKFNSDFFDNFARNIKSSVSSRFFVYAVLTAFIVSALNQISDYYSAMIINSRFSSKNELSAFLSIYTICADFTTLLIQLFIVSKVINNFGVRRSNYIYPSAIFTFIAACLAFPSIATGTLLRFIRKNLGVIIKTPVFNIIMAASPRDRMAEVKSFISGIINSTGMIAGGLAIFIISRKLTSFQGYCFTALLCIIYLLLTLLQNKSYVKSLGDRIKFDSHLREDNIEFVPDNYTEYISKDNISGRNIPLIEAVFNIKPALESIDSIIVFYDSLDSITKENILNLLQTGKSEFESEVLNKAITDKDPRIRSIALSIVSGKNLNYRKEIFQNKYNEMLYGEKIAVSILSGDMENMDIDSVNNFAMEKLTKIKDSVLNNELSVFDFIMLIQAMPYQYFLNHLYDLIIIRKNNDLLKCIIPFADRLSRRRIVKLIYTFRNGNIDHLIKLTMMSKNIPVIDASMLLDYRDISFDAMKKLYKYDKKTASIFFDRLLKNRSYRNKSGYLKYFLCTGIKPYKELEIFIDYEIIKIREIERLSFYLKKLISKSEGDRFIICRFFYSVCQDVIELKKHLILKAVSIETGFKIDDVYDSNILFHDHELNSFILEYMDSSVKQRKDVLSIFDKTPIDYGNYSGNNFFSEDRSHVSYNYLITFLPEISGLLKYCLSVIPELLPGSRISEKYKSSEEARMLSTIEKLVFLKENKMFSDLKINELVNIARIACEAEYPSGATVIRQGEIGDRLYIIINGEVKVFTEKREIATMGPGNCMGELSIIDDEPRSASVKTTCKSRMLYIDRKDFLLTLKDNPAISINIMQVITGRIRGLL